MESSLYVALSSQLALERRLTTIADNVSNMNTVGFRSTEVKFNEVLATTDNNRYNFVSPGDEFLSPDKGAIVQTGNPLDFAIKGTAWFSIDSPAGPALTRDGRFSLTDAGQLVSIEGYPVLDAGGGPIQLDAAQGPVTVSSDGVLHQNGNPVAQLGVYEAYTDTGYTRVGNTAIIPAGQPQPVVDRMDIGVVQGYLEESNVNGVSQITQMMMVQRSFDQVSSFIRDAESSMQSAIRTLGGSNA